MDSEHISRRILALAKSLTAAEELQLMDEDDIVDELEDALGRYLSGSSEVDKTEIIFYEEETKSGQSVRVEVTVNPNNQPKVAGKIKVGLYIVGDEGAPTYEDGVWVFDDDETIRKVAQVIGQAAQKTLRRF